MFQEIITRAEAIERGLKRYFTGKPCKHGHIAERATQQCGCVECESVRRAKYQMENPDKVRESSSRYRQKNPDYYAKYRKDNKDKERARQTKYQMENPDKVRESSSRYRQKNQGMVSSYHAKYRQVNADKIRSQKARYYQENPGIRLSWRSQRRAAKIQRLPSWFDEFDQFVMTEAEDLSKRRESITGYKWHVDHMIPLRSRNASGLHCASNLQVIPATLNMRKSNKMMFTEPGEWIKAL